MARTALLLDPPPAGGRPQAGRLQPGPRTRAVFVPCAGPVLAAITVSGATGRIGAGTLALTLSFAVGVAIPLLFFALAGRGLAERLKAFRRRQKGIRILAGVLMIALAAGLAFDLPAAVQRLIPDYTASFQEKLTPSQGSPLDLGGVATDENKDLSKCTQGSTELQDCGPAPELRGINAWLGSDPLTLKQLKGKVVLLDFWPTPASTASGPCPTSPRSTRRTVMPVSR